MHSRRGDTARLRVHQQRVDKHVQTTRAPESSDERQMHEKLKKK